MHLSALSTGRNSFRPHYACAFCVLVLLAVLISSCASTGDTKDKAGLSRTDATDRIPACKSTDRQVASSDQCLQDDAACYQISGGQWCTGERGSVCPAGSTPLEAGAACPANARCFKFSESLECMI